jgi:hypothetical protein
MLWPLSNAWSTSMLPSCKPILSKLTPNMYDSEAQRLSP